ncbi:MAG: lipid-A-disaccharide synthase [Kiritimatiellia bacterium]
MSKLLKIYICAGEVSGDLHGAALMQALKELYPGKIVFRGFGGDHMQAEGLELLYHTDQTAVCGITPVLKELPFLLSMMKHIKKDMLEWQPDLVLTVDYPGMNLRLAKFAHRQGLRTIHYICPQVWAWHRSRIPKIARYIDRLLCIFPFEPEHFAETDLDVLFTGHPLVDRVWETCREPAPDFPWSDGYRIALLPGSRRREITRILPRILDAAVLLEKKLGGSCSFIIPAPTRRMLDLARSTCDSHGNKPASLEFIEGHARHLMLQADAAAIASGTATLEASLIRCPAVLVYCAAPLTAFFARILIKGVRFLGLANIIADREVMPELLQENFTPQALCDHLHKYLVSDEVRKQTLAGLDTVNARLGEGNASERAAHSVLDFMSAQKKVKR